MDKSRIEEKINAAEAHFEIAKHLDTRRVLEIENVPGGFTAQKEAKDRHVFHSKQVCHMLYAIVFEISIKVIWDLDHNKACKFTHNVSKLFLELAGESQEKIREIYDEHVSSMAGLAVTMGGEQKRLGEIVQFSTLCETLLANEATMKDFKYDTKFKGKSTTVGSTLWDDQTVWALPSGYTPFAANLFYYTKERLAERSTN